MGWDSKFRDSRNLGMQHDRRDSLGLESGRLAAALAQEECARMQRTKGWRSQQTVPWHLMNLDESYELWKRNKKYEHDLKSLQMKPASLKLDLMLSRCQAVLLWGVSLNLRLGNPWRRMVFYALTVFGMLLRYSTWCDFSDDCSRPGRCWLWYDQWQDSWIPQRVPSALPLCELLH